jgi:hypothetical protein
VGSIPSFAWAAPFDQMGADRSCAHSE